MKGENNLSLPNTVWKEVDGRAVEVFESWSERANFIVATKYFQRIHGELENSVPQMIRRVVNAIYPKDHDAAQELLEIMTNQEAALNSPCQFNLGVPGRDPQCSACFILPLDDSMDSIREWWSTEAAIFRLGSGSGVNLSNIRSKGSPLSGGGYASGPLSFMGPSDAIAGSIKSGGMTRRSAKMMILNADHPDIYSFVWAKVREERKVQALLKAGFSEDMEGEAYSSVLYQNANLSVGVTNDFMQLAAGDPVRRAVNERHLLSAIASAAHAVGDPGLFFLDAVNAMHTTPSAGPIRACNPCGEFLRPDGEACNLASINLMKFWDFDAGHFLSGKFARVVRTMIQAMDTIVDLATYPTSEIEMNSRAYRPLGLGYSNLGALLMTLGIPYDSDEGRSLAGAMTSLMTAVAYHESIKLAKVRGKMPGMTDGDVEQFTAVLETHKAHTYDYGCMYYPELWSAAKDWWHAVTHLAECGDLPRNCQVTLLAPTGTISFMMDCDTTGIEPVYAHNVTKTLAGGGSLTMSTAHLVERGMKALGKKAHEEEYPLALPFAATAVGSNSIRPLAHVEMVAAVQPFLSGGVSKTVNLPNSATMGDILDVYTAAWEMGLKAISVYRDGCKGVQAIVPTEEPQVEWSSGSVFQDLDLPEPGPRLREAAERYAPERVAVRVKLPTTREAMTHKFTVGVTEGYLTAGYYDNGELGEIFLRVTREGSTLSAVLDAFATVVSLALQYGVPFEVIAEKFIGSKFEPSGFTSDPHIPMTSSILDYVFRWLRGEEDYPEREEHGVYQVGVDVAKVPHHSIDGHLCPLCGSVMIQSGTCRTCPSCGTTSGGCN